MELIGDGGQVRLSLPQPAGVVAVVLAAVLGAGIAAAAVGAGDAARAAAPPGPPATGVPVRATPTEPATSPAVAACVDALARAEEALTEAREVDRVLRAQTDVMNDLLAERIDADEALERALPGLNRGAQRSTALEAADERYRAATPSCRQ